MGTKLTIGYSFWYKPEMNYKIYMLPGILVILVAVIGIFLTFFFMIVFIMMSGIFTPNESMPDWAQWINVINPLAYFNAGHSHDVTQRIRLF